MVLVGAGDGVSLLKSISWPTAASLIAEDSVAACWVSFNTQHQHEQCHTHVFLAFSCPMRSCVILAPKPGFYFCTT